MNCDDRVGRCVEATEQVDIWLSDAIVIDIGDLRDTVSSQNITREVDSSAIRFQSTRFGGADCEDVAWSNIEAGHSPWQSRVSRVFKGQLHSVSVGNQHDKCEGTTLSECLICGQNIAVRCVYHPQVRRRVRLHRDQIPAVGDVCAERGWTGVPVEIAPEVPEVGEGDRTCAQVDFIDRRHLLRNRRIRDDPAKSVRTAGPVVGPVVR